MRRLEALSSVLPETQGEVSAGWWLPRSIRDSELRLLTTGEIEVLLRAIGRAVEHQGGSVRNIDKEVVIAPETKGYLRGQERKVRPGTFLNLLQIMGKERGSVLSRDIVATMFYNALPLEEAENVKKILRRVSPLMGFIGQRCSGLMLAEHYPFELRVGEPLNINWLFEITHDRVRLVRMWGGVSHEDMGRGVRQEKKGRRIVAIQKGQPKASSVSGTAKEQVPKPARRETLEGGRAMIQRLKNKYGERPLVVIVYGAPGGWGTIGLKGGIMQKRD